MTFSLSSLGNLGNPSLSMLGSLGKPNLANLSSLSGLFSSAFNLGDLGVQPVSIGNVTLEGFEVPDAIPFGGQQQLTTHKLVGGNRVIDAMGPDEKEISFTGKFFGANATDKANTLDEMRKSAIPVDLIWGQYFRRVIIADFDCSYTLVGSLLPYTLKFIVLPDIVSVESEQDIQESIKNDLDSANDILKTDESKGVKGIAPVSNAVTKAKSSENPDLSQVKEELEYQKTQSVSPIREPIRTVGSNPELFQMEEERAFQNRNNSQELIRRDPSWKSQGPVDETLVATYNVEKSASLENSGSFIDRAIRKTQAALNGV